MTIRHRIAALIPAAFLFLAACAPQPTIATAPPQPQPQPTWAFENSDVPVDPAYRFGRLANGMRYVIRHNATPQGTALVRMEIESGSLSERDSERGYAHYVEHMAFNGSTRIPEGEMVKLLEREGLAFGADTNASTGFEETLYKLDLPRNDLALLDTALMLMRETASELTFDQKAVERERGVVMAEMRDRNTYALRNAVDAMKFSNPEALYPDRLPIGTAEALNAATADSLRAFWQREYVPANATIVVIGDFDPALVESAIIRHFENWQSAPLPVEPDPGPVDTKRKGETDIFVDPALSERITLARHGPWRDEPDSIATRQARLLREIGYRIVNRRFQRIARQDSPPFRDAGIGTGDIFKVGRTTRLIVDTGDGEWRRGLVEAAWEYRRALEHGFTDAEVAEQLANIRTAAENAASSAATRSNTTLFNAVLDLLREERVPATPESSLERLLAFIPRITPQAVMAAMKADMVPLKDPLLRFEGRTAPAGGADALRATWRQAAAEALPKPDSGISATFAYTDFGPAGAVASDQREEGLGIREVIFANGVRLNLKRTELERDRIRIGVNLDGGQMLNTPGKPLATAMTSSLPSGGLGRHSEDELQSILAGRSVDLSIDDAGETFTLYARTTPRDLELQLQLLTAAIADPGYRPQGESRYRRNIANYFARKDATPASALSNALGGILSDDDPRFTLQPLASYRALTFAGLRDAIADRLAHGAIEIALVGDLDEEQAIALIGKTLGALPAREARFQPYDDRRMRPFTATRGQHIIRHKGQADQALLRFAWPTRDDSDQMETLQLQLLERVLRIELLDSLREALGKAYSPGASSDPSTIYRGYGTLSLTASVDIADVEETRAAILATIAELREKPLSEDVLRRARQPLLESYENALKGNAGWMNLVERAQGKPERIGRFLNARDRISSITARDLQVLADRYLAPADAVEVLVLPERKGAERKGAEQNTPEGNGSEPKGANPQ